MEQLVLEQTKITPEVNFDIVTNVFEIKGISMPENPIAFYSPIFEWLDNYAKAPIENNEFILQLDYFNTSTAKMILDIFNRVKNIGHGNKIVWKYHIEDDDMKEAGIDYVDIVGDILRVESYED